MKDLAFNDSTTPFYTKYLVKYYIQDMQAALFESLLS